MRMSSILLSAANTNAGQLATWIKIEETISHGTQLCQQLATVNVLFVVRCSGKLMPYLQPEHALNRIAKNAATSAEGNGAQEGRSGCRACFANRAFLLTLLWLNRDRPGECRAETLTFSFLRRRRILVARHVPQRRAWPTSMNVTVKPQVLMALSVLAKTKNLGNARAHTGLRDMMSRRKNKITLLAALSNLTTAKAKKFLLLRPFQHAP